MTRAVLTAIVAGCVVVVAATQAHGQAISGSAEAVDGDTLSMTGTRIRLAGIDAVEAKQTCERDGITWACGEEARQKLAVLIGSAQVECIGRERDIYGRLVATCRVGHIDLGEAMVREGLAIALAEASPDYTEAEGRVRQFGFGIWGSTFEKPADWRAAHPQERPKVEQVAAKASASQVSARPRIWRDDLGRCAIKGNHSRHGDWIYHMPGQAYYHQTRPEALFCTEGDAQKAGYRPSKM